MGLAEKLDSEILAIASGNAIYILKENYIKPHFLTSRKRKINDLVVFNRRLHDGGNCELPTG